MSEAAESTGATAAALRATAPAERVALLDVLRGLAVFGILVVNLQYFAQPMGVVMARTPETMSAADLWVTRLIRWLFEAKFYSIFSLLFGYGIALQVRRALARGMPYLGRLARRLSLLALLGAMHVLLLWYGDILLTYAFLGFWLLLFLARSQRALLIWAALLIGLPCLGMAGIGLLTLIAGQNDPIVQQAVQAELRAQQARDAAALTAYREGSLREIFDQRISEYWLSTGSMIAFIFPHILGTFLLGLYAGRREILERPQAHLPLLARCARVGLPLGLLLNAIHALCMELGASLDTSAAMQFGIALLLPGATTLAIGYVAFVALLMRSEAIGRWLAPLASVGRMALSNYLLQSVICTTLCYSYGLAWYGRVEPAMGLLLTVVIFALQIPLSRLWLASFDYGPVEWIWRTLTYGRMPPRRPRPARLGVAAEATGGNDDGQRGAGSLRRSSDRHEPPERSL